MTDTPVSGNSGNDRSLLAAELVLGLLDGEELAAALRLQMTDPAFAKEAELWQQHLAPLYEDYQSADAPEGIYDAVQARIDTMSGAQTQTVTHLDPQEYLYGRMKLWRAAAFATGILAMVSLYFIAFVKPRPVDDKTQQIAVTQPEQDPELGPEQEKVEQEKQVQKVAQLSGEEPELFVVMKWNPESGTLNVKTTGLSRAILLDEAQMPELWVIPEDGTPRSLGAIPPNTAGEIAVSPELRKFIEEGATVAVTLEDPSKAPHKTPTMPIIASGKVSEI